MLPTIILTAADSRYYKACVRDSFQRGESPLIHPARISWLNPLRLREEENYLQDCYLEWGGPSKAQTVVYLDQDFPHDQNLGVMAIQPEIFQMRAFLGSWEIPSYDLEFVYDNSDGLYYCACYDSNIYHSGETPREALNLVKHEYKLHYT